MSGFPSSGEIKVGTWLNRRRTGEWAHEGGGSHGAVPARPSWTLSLSNKYLRPFQGYSCFQTHAGRRKASGTIRMPQILAHGITQHGRLSTEGESLAAFGPTQRPTYPTRALRTALLTMRQR